MVCKNCGATIADGVTYCPVCGTKFTNGDFDKTVGNYSTVPPTAGQGYAPQGAQSAQSTSYAVAASTVKDEFAAGQAGVSFGKAVKMYFKNYANFSARSSRSEYWWTVLFNGLVSLGTSILVNAFLMFAPVLAFIIQGLSALYGLATLVPGLAISIRRLRDIGKDWYWIFMAFIPCAGPIIMIVYYCKESGPDNQWGPSPLGKKAVPANGFVPQTTYTTVNASYAAPQPMQRPTPVAPVAPVAPAPVAPVAPAPVKKETTNEDVVRLAQNHVPFEFTSPESRAQYINPAIAKFLPYYDGVTPLAGALMMNDPETIKANVAAADTDSLFVFFKVLGYEASKGGDVSTLSMVQNAVLEELKKRV